MRGKPPSITSPPQWAWAEQSRGPCTTPSNLAANAWLARPSSAQARAFSRGHDHLGRTGPEPWSSRSTRRPASAGARWSRPALAGPRLASQRDRAVWVIDSASAADDASFGASPTSPSTAWIKAPLTPSGSDGGSPAFVANRNERGPPPSSPAAYQLQRRQQEQQLLLRQQRMQLSSTGVACLSLHGSPRAAASSTSTFLLPLPHEIEDAIMAPPAAAPAALSVAGPSYGARSAPVETASQELIGSKDGAFGNANLRTTHPYASQDLAPPHKLSAWQEVEQMGLQLTPQPRSKPGRQCGHHSTSLSETRIRLGETRQALSILPPLSPCPRQL